MNERLKEDFRYLIKQKGGLLAKGRLLGVQSKAAFETDLYLEMGRHANRMATLLRDGIRDLGYDFLVDSPTNQLFPVFPNGLADKLSTLCSFEEEGPVDAGHRSIRFVTSWATPEEDVRKLLEVIRQLG